MKDKVFELSDVSNSILWFLMDVFWMFERPDISFWLIVPTLILGLISSFSKMEISSICIGMSVNAWFMMNVFWMLENTFYAKIMLSMGILLIVLSIIISKNLKVLYRFSRFRKLF